MINNKFQSQGIFLLIIFISLSQSVLADNKLIFSSSVGMPFSNTENSGFEDEIVKQMFSSLGYTVKVRFTPAQRALHTLNDGIDDGALGRTKGSIKKFKNIVQIPEKAFDRDFVVFTKWHKFKPNGWDSLKPYNVGIIRGWKILENNINKSKSLIKVKDGNALFNLLAEDRVDVIIYNRWGGLQKIKELNLNGFELLEPPLVSAPHYFNLNIKHISLVRPASEKLQKMKKDGTYTKIFNSTLLKLVGE